MLSENRLVVWQASHLLHHHTTSIRLTVVVFAGVRYVATCNEGKRPLCEMVQTAVRSTTRSWCQVHFAMCCAHQHNWAVYKDSKNAGRGKHVLIKHTMEWRSADDTHQYSYNEMRMSGLKACICKNRNDCEVMVEIAGCNNFNTPHSNHQAG